MDTNFTSDERELMLMLLQKEETNLLIGINRCVHREFKVYLKEQLHLVTALLEKLKIAEHAEAV